jgi:rubrerythrin
MFAGLFRSPKRSFSSLTEQEILAVAIAAEEDDSRIYLAYADILRLDYPASAKVFEDMAGVEDTHRKTLIDMHRKRFGERIPLIRREHVDGFYERKPDWLRKSLPLEAMRQEAEAMEGQAYRFYVEAAKRTSDASTRKLLGDLALAEQGHEDVAAMLADKHTPTTVKQDEDADARRKLILTYVQPGLAGLMDGSVSTLAPIFAAAFATQDTWQTFLVGLSASVGAGISMGFTKLPMTMARFRGAVRRSSAGLPAAS